MNVRVTHVAGWMLCAATALAQWPDLAGQPLRTAPIITDGDGTVYVVNPDNDSATKLTPATGGTQAKLWEGEVGDYPRTITIWGDFILTANQNADTISKLSKQDGSRAVPDVSLGFGCAPFGIVGDHGGSHMYVSCQGTQEVVVLDANLGVQARIKLDYPNPRSMALTADDTRLYVTHFLTNEPDTDAHVSEIDTAANTLSNRRVLRVPADRTTCETQNSGQGVLNAVNAIALAPSGDDTPPEVRGQLWVGGTFQNNLTKGLFRRFHGFKGKPEIALFDLPCPETAEGEPALACLFDSFPPGNGESAVRRNLYKASFHDVTRFVIWKLDLASGEVVGKIDVDEANHATDLQFSRDGRVAYVVDQTFHSFHVLNTLRGQGTNPATIFAGVADAGPWSADPSRPCSHDAIGSVTSEVPFILDPQAQITPIDGGNPFRLVANVAVPVNTGVDFDTRTYHESGVAQMREVPDSVGSAPIGVALSPDGCIAYVANYLSRNVVAMSARPGVPSCSSGGQVVDFRCTRDVTDSCASRRDCSNVGGGFCGHPGGATCASDADCTSGNGPCVLSNDCQPLVVADATGTAKLVSEEIPAEILDGKILFNTSARDGSVPNGIGLDLPAPLFQAVQKACSNDTAMFCTSDDDCIPGTCSVVASLPGEIVSTAHDASYVSCTSCHVDYGAQDGRTWDFSQFGASLRNTMDLRGRSRFAPGTCKATLSSDAGKVGSVCHFDAACGSSSAPGACGYDPNDDTKYPAHLDTADERANFFNPMGTVHWNGDRMEVEGFEFTFQQLMGAADCDGNETDPSKCPGGLMPRHSSISSSVAPQDGSIGGDLRNSLRNVMVMDPLLNKELNVSVRLTHMADFVYSLTEFPRNPHLGEGNTALSAAAQRGRSIFNDQSVKCGSCHNGPSAQNQLFTDKAPNGGFDPGQPPGGATNNPFKRQAVGTANVFDLTDPDEVAAVTGYQNSAGASEGKGIPASRAALVDYVTPVMNDAWNTPPFLHDGSAPTLLEVVRPCDTGVTDCNQKGLGRNIDDLHGVTSHLTPQQLNDLVAYQLAPHNPVSTSETTVKAGELILTKGKLSFGKKPGKGLFSFKAIAKAGGLTADPTQGGLTLTIATPANGTMVLFERVGAADAVKVTGEGKRIAFAADGVSVRMKASKTGDFVVTIKGKKLDLSALDNGSRDVTVALVVGTAQFVDNRVLVPKKKGRLFALPKGGK